MTFEWDFQKPQRNSFNELKSLVTESPVLRFFDPNLPIRVTSDASKDGLGAVLEQSFNENWYPVAYTSRSLTSSEQNYCQLEKEYLSIVFVCEKFHQYVYGQEFFVENEHQPLKIIFTKEIIKAPPRIQRFLLRLQRYDFTLNYRSGKDVIVADALSRAFLDDSTTEIPEKELEFVVDSVISNLPRSDARLEQFKKETAQDATLLLLKNY